MALGAKDGDALISEVISNIAFCLSSNLVVAFILASSQLQLGIMNAAYVILLSPTNEPLRPIYSMKTSLLNKLK